MRVIKNGASVVANMPYLINLLSLSLLSLILSSSAVAFTLPANFTDNAVIEGLQDPDGFDFSPDGRMFISERISGKLRIAKYNAGSDSWILNATPFYTFDTPKNGSGQPEAVRSAGLRDITFDPNFASNGYVYAFYMSDDERHNRVVRVKASAADPDLADTTFGEQLLLNLPFNGTQSSGSHNGGALEFGGDGKLYITSGDGWEGEFAGADVQSLSTFTGKVFRINSNGTIPSDNPFYTQASGDLRAIYALGLRNPYSMSRHPDTDLLYINEARGTNKASIYIVEASANYQHEGSGIGNNRTPWANASGAGGELLTGGAWLTESGLGNFPATYYGRYFTALWGSNSSSTGRINTIASDSDTTSTTFATGLGVIGDNNIPVKPVIARFRQDGDLYYMLTTYTTSSGQIRRVQFTSQETAAAPTFTPNGGNTELAVMVSISSDTSPAEIRYTLNNSPVTVSSTLYTSAITIDQSRILRARTFKAGFNTSSETSAVYIIGNQDDNIPPDVNAGEDKVGFVGQAISLDGSASTDPDGNDDFLTDELWTQLAGPAVTIEDATEEIAFFTASETGIYRFRLDMSDGIDTGSDEVVISVIMAPRVESGLQALYTFEDGDGSTSIADVSAVGAALDLTIETPLVTDWLEGGGLQISGAASIVSDGAAKIVSACSANNEFSLEAWLTPENTTQAGPARIVSLSVDLTNRNFTLGQEDDRYDVRLRTSATNNNGTPSIIVPASTVKTELTHVVYTRDSAGNAAIYINSIPQVVGNVGGTISNWNAGYDLMLANEVTGDRSWLGDLFLVAVYCQALDDNQVTQNFAAGLPPYSSLVDTDEDTVPDVIDNCPVDANQDQANLDGDAAGDVCDTDIDNDGLSNGIDSEPLNNRVCQDSDADQCDDCAIGVDGFGELSDVTPANDGPDNDNDGLCDIGDVDDDQDLINDDVDNCPINFNPNQSDENGNGIGDACDPASEFCIVVPTANNAAVTFCL